MDQSKRKILKILRHVSKAMSLRVMIELSNRRFIMPLYHAVSDVNEPHLKHLYNVRTTAMFEKDLDTFLKYYKPMALDELVKRSRREDIKIMKPRFFLSFDDGLRSCKEVIAPILKRKGIPATFFVTSGFVDNNELFFRHKISLIIDSLKNKNVNESQRKEISNILNFEEFNTEMISKYLLGLQNRGYGHLDKIGVVLNIDFKEFLRLEKPYLFEEEIAELIKDGFTFGAHSVDHVNFKDISFLERHQQVVQSVDFVCETGGFLPSHLPITELVKNSLIIYFFAELQNILLEQQE